MTTPPPFRLYRIVREEKRTNQHGIASWWRESPSAGYEVFDDLNEATEKAAQDVAFLLGLRQRNVDTQVRLEQLMRKDVVLDEFVWKDAGAHFIVAKKE